MTIEELAKLKKGDKLMCGERILTFDHAQAVLFDSCMEEYRVDIKTLRVIPGPTLPPHVAEIWEWDGEPKKNGDIEGWVWDDAWAWPRHGCGNYYHGVYRLIRKRCACQKESK